MPSLGFSGSNLATVAYAEVDGLAGASTVTNSGVRTTRTALGTYVVVLPTTLAQSSPRDLIFVQPLDTAGTTPVPLSASVEDTLDCTKVVHIWLSDGDREPFDRSFSILILRTTISPPVGGPG